MCRIDLQLEEKELTYARYVDDITFSFSTEVQKNDFIKQFLIICQQYNLSVNDKKTEIESFPLLIKIIKNKFLHFSINTNTMV